MKSSVSTEGFENEKDITCKLGDSDVHTLEDPTLILEILSGRFFLRLNLPDHRSVFTGFRVKMEMEIPRTSGVYFITACSYSTNTSNDNMKVQAYVLKLPLVIMSKNLETIENVIEDESHSIMKVVDNDLGALTMFTKHFIGREGLVVLGEGCVGAGGGEVSGGGDDFEVSKSLLGEIPRVVIGESGGETLEMIEEPFGNRLGVIELGMEVMTDKGY
ncbi:hypothetical protein Tco_1367648 [Tanacetum coccineum]